MTGYGQATERDGDAACAVEARAVNNRFLKLQVRVPERFAAWEPRLEKLVRDAARRGTITVSVRLSGVRGSGGAATLDTETLRDYRTQLAAAFPGEAVPLAALLQLPGAVDDRHDPEAAVTLLPLVERAVAKALAELRSMRAAEGASMKAELTSLAHAVGDLAEEIAARATVSVAAHRDRMLERVQSLLAPSRGEIAASDLVRELSILAERGDIAEELARLRAHRDRLLETLAAGGEGAGRRLDFLAQELHREANTLGAKANDVRIAGLAVELKTRIEGIRELVQNVE